MLAQHGMSVNALAKQVGVSQPYISRMIRGLRYKRPTGEFAGNVALALDLPVDYWPEYRIDRLFETIRADPALRDRLYDEYGGGP